MTSHNEIDTEYTREIMCPYCGFEYGDSWECGPSEGERIWEEECPECGESFKVSRWIAVNYSTYKMESDEC